MGFIEKIKERNKRTYCVATYRFTHIKAKNLMNE